MYRRAMKSLLAVAAVTSAPLAEAQSSVTVYGAIDSTLRRASNPGTDGRTALNDGFFYASRLGFQGSEALGGGLKAVFNIEMGLDPSTGQALLGSTSAGYGQAVTTGPRAWGRQSFVGLGSVDFGTLTLGRQYTLMQNMSGRFMARPNPNSAVVSIMSTYHLARQDNMAKYVYTRGSFGFGASHTFGESLNGGGNALSASYTRGPLDLVAYGERVAAANASFDRRMVWGAGGSYAVTPTFKGFLGMMRRTQTGSAIRNDVYHGSFTFDVMPTVQVAAGYTLDKQRQFANTPGGHRKVGYLTTDFRLSKRSIVYVEVDRNIYTGGFARPTFIQTGASAQTGFGMGLQHLF